VPSPFETGAYGGSDRERLRPEDAVCAPLDTMLIRVSSLERDELRNAVNSLLEKTGNSGEQGWKLYAPEDAPVYCVARGVVRQINSWRKAVSLAIELSAYSAIRLAEFHGAHQLIAFYSGLGSTSVTVGDAVSAGDVLGRIGEAGAGSLPHLRFELRTSLRRGKLINPGELLELPETGIGAACS
jgi:murein DD-endopeptidase MepM/ murein hydrolase activator NlpD